MRYEAVIFDLFGTLVPYVGDVEFRASLAPTAAALGCRGADLEAAWCTKQNYVSAVTQPTPLEVKLALFCEQLGMPTDQAAIAAAVQTRLEATRKWLSPKPTAVRTLEMLKAVGYRLGLMSECSVEVPRVWPETPFAGYFDAALFSCETGRMKSDPSFFLDACARIGARPRAIAYVGDAEVELATARAMGMLAVLMQTRKQIPWVGLRVAEPWDVVAIVAREKEGKAAVRKLHELRERRVGGV